MAIQVKKDSELRLRKKHPWILKTDVQVIPKNFRDGACTDFINAKGEFLGFGYFNSKSKISGRILTFDSQKKSITQKEKLTQHLFALWQDRKKMDFLGSFRLCYGESDQLPGLIIDYYLVSDAQVFVLQISTLGMEILFNDYYEILEKISVMAFDQQVSERTWNQTAIVLRNDLSVRKFEGLEVDVPRVVKTPRDLDLTQACIFINSVVHPGQRIPMFCDLYQGQKTGFFLDQFENIKRVALFLDNKFQDSNFKSQYQNKPFRLVDLCCYVGHWSTQIISVLIKHQISFEVHLVDVSTKALQFAEKNVLAQQNQAMLGTAKVVVHKKNVLEELGDFESSSFDLVIADPPAFIKSKKDIPTGQHAYFKLNTQAFRMAASHGYVVSCTCSGHLSEDMLMNAIKKSLNRESKNANLVLTGSHSADHPWLDYFPEAHYLKMYMHEVV